MRVLFVSLVIVLADQVTKLLVKGVSIPALGIELPGVPLGSSRPVFGDLVRLTYIENPGMAFGIDFGLKVFFALLSIAASIGIIIYLYKTRSEVLPFRLSLALILGGAIGNLIDRVFYGVFFNEGALFYGKVVDFIDCDFFNLDILGYHLNRWPVFNIADASVTCGVILLLLVHRRMTQEREVLVPQPIPVNAEGIPPITDPHGAPPLSPDDPSAASDSGNAPAQ